MVTCEGSDEERERERRVVEGARETEGQIEGHRAGGKARRLRSGYKEQGNVDGWVG